MDRRTLASLLGLVVTIAASSASGATDSFGDPLPEGAVQRLGTLRMKGPLQHFSYLPDGRAVVAAGKYLTIWDLAKGDPHGPHAVSTAHVRSVRTRRDGRAALFADSDGNVVEWDLVELKHTRSFPTGQAGLRGARYSPDETRVLTIAGPSATVREWDLASGKQLVSIDAREDDAKCYANGAVYGPGGRTAFVHTGRYGVPNILAHWDLTTGKKIGEFTQGFGRHGLYGLSLSADGKRLLVGTRYTAVELQIAGYKHLNTFRDLSHKRVRSVAYCHEPEQFLAGSADGSICRWNRLTGERLLRWRPHESQVLNVQVSPDGKRVLSYGSGVLAETTLATGKPRLDWPRHMNSVEAVAFLPDGKHVVSGSLDGTLRVWGVESGKGLQVMKANAGVHAVAVSPDGSRVAAACRDGMIRQYKLADGSTISEAEGHGGSARSILYSHDGTRIISSADDGTVRVWSANQTRKKWPALITLREHLGGVLAVAISPDGRSVLSGGRDGRVLLWNLDREEGRRLGVVQAMEGHRGWVTRVTFAGEGHAISADRRGRVCRWELESGKLVEEVLATQPLTALAYSPDGGAAYAATKDNCVTCWDLEAKVKTGTLLGHRGPVNAMALSPDGKLLVTASADTTLLVWRTPAQ